MELDLRDLEFEFGDLSFPLGAIATLFVNVTERLIQEDAIVTQF